MKAVTNGGYSYPCREQGPMAPTDSGEVEISMFGLASRPATVEADPEELAFRALGFLADRPTIFRHFLAVNRLTEAELLRLPIRRKHLAAVLAFVVRDEGLMDELSRRTGLSSDGIHRARRDLYRSMSGP